MIVSFWSSVHGQTCTTSNLSALASYCVLAKDLNCAVLQTHYNLNPIENIFLGDFANISEEGDIDSGIDALLKLAGSKDLTVDDVIECSTVAYETKKKKQLSVIYSTRLKNEAIYTSNISDPVRLNRVLDALDKAFDIVFIDTNSGGSELSNMVRERANYTVVNLSQNRFVIDSLFEHFKVDDSMFFMLGMYDYRSRYNLHNIQRLNKQLKGSRTGSVAYNVEFRDAINDGKLLRFMLKNLNCNKIDTNFEFINELAKSADRFLNFIGKGKQNDF